MTDAELADAALIELEQTTRGLSGYSAPAASHWGKALKLLSQVSAATAERDDSVLELRQTTVGYTYYTKRGATPGLETHWGKALAYLADIGDYMNIGLSTSGGTSNLAGTVLITCTPQYPAKVISVEFRIDNVSKATDTSSPYTYSWNTTAVKDGAHEISARVLKVNNRVQTVKLPVTVKNAAAPPPPPPIQDPPVNTSAPAISPTGAVKEGQSLSVSTGTWTNSPTSYTYAWLRCDSGGANCTAIPSATGSTYVLVTADVGSTVRCTVTAYNTVGASAAIPTAQTQVVSSLTPAVPVNVTAPTIAGTAVQGNTLSSSTGSWTNSPTSYLYQWKRCDSAGNNPASISGATAYNYIVATADVGSTIKSQVTAQNASGNSTPKLSAATAVVTSPQPPAPPPPTFNKYAAPNGSDSNPGTISAPYASMQKLMDSLLPGQTGCLRGGTYGTIDTVSDFRVNGTSNARIRVTAYPGEVPLVKGYMVFRNDYITVDHIRFDNSNRQHTSDFTECPQYNPRAIGTYLAGDNIIFEYNEVFQSSSTLKSSALFNGAGADLGNNNIVRYCKIHDVSICLDFEHGYYIGSGNNVEVAYNWFWNIPYGWAIQLYPEPTNCRVHHNVFDATGCGVVFDDNGGGECHGNLAYNNVITNQTGVSNRNGQLNPGAGNYGHAPTGAGNRFDNNCCFGNPGGIGSQTNVAQTGNFIADPMYVNRAAHDYRVQAGSPVASWGLWDGTGGPV